MNAADNRSPDWFLDGVVQPTLDDFLLHRDCVRRGMLAALAVSSPADHVAVAASERSGVLGLHSPGGTLPKEERPKPFKEVAAFRRSLARRCRDFALVRDVADATKHARLDGVSGVQRHVEVVEGRDGRPIIGRDGSPLETGGVAVVPPDGFRRPLAGPLAGAIVFLREEMGR